MNILIVADSDGGATAIMGEAVAEGAKGISGVEVKHLNCEEAKEEDLLWADGIALGCPTHMGTISWKMKKFIDFCFGPAWVGQKLVGKVGAVFNTGGSGASGGSELALIGLVSNMMQNGMIFVGHLRDAPGFKPEGTSWGPVWTAWGDRFKPNNDQLNAAQAHGKRLAEVTGQLK